MSSYDSPKRRIAIYVAGLGQDSSFFSHTIEKVVNEYEYKHVKCTTKVDMTMFDCTGNDFFGYSDTRYTDVCQRERAKFNNSIAAVASLLQANPNKTIHLAVDISKALPVPFTLYYIEHPEDIQEAIKNIGNNDSIENQKIKLEYIINALKRYFSDLQIILIGHSQGGLVNLEVACDKPNQIQELVSISTPYSPVIIARDAMRLVHALSFLELESSSETNLFSSQDQQRYLENVERLSGQTYFTNLKRRWNNIPVTSKPKIRCITGTSGTLAYDMLTLPKKTSYDGLVRTYSQSDISNGVAYNLKDPKTSCEAKYLNNNCDVLPQQCLQCTLPAFCVEATVLQTLRDNIEIVEELVNQFLRGEEIVVPSDIENIIDNHPIVKIIKNEINLNDRPDPNSRNTQSIKLYQNFSDVFISEYSHRWIAESDAAVLLIRAFTQI